MRKRIWSTANALIATDSAPGTVLTKDVGRLSKLSDVIKFAGIGFALALLMMLGLILILELMRSGKRQARAGRWAAGCVRMGAALRADPADRSAGGTRDGRRRRQQPAGARDPWRASPLRRRCPLTGTATATDMSTETGRPTHRVPMSSRSAPAAGSFAADSDVIAAGGRRQAR